MKQEAYTPENQAYVCQFIAAWQTTGQPCFFNCSVETFHNWFPGVLNSWHIITPLGDPNGCWDNFLQHVDYLAPYLDTNQPGHAGDLGVFPINVPTRDQWRAQFGVDALFSTPLLLPNFGDGVTDVTNADVIAVQQDPAAFGAFWPRRTAGCKPGSSLSTRSMARPRQLAF